MSVTCVFRKGSNFGSIGDSESLTSGLSSSSDETRIAEALEDSISYSDEDEERRWSDGPPKKGGRGPTDKRSESVRLAQEKAKKGTEVNKGTQGKVEAQGKGKQKATVRPAVRPIK